MRPSRIGQHIKDEPCAKQRALLSVPPAVAQAFLEGSDLRRQFLPFSPLVKLKAVLSSTIDNKSPPNKGNCALKR
jgi:hypothetical protein